jgi:hypothetical protein
MAQPTQQTVPDFPLLVDGDDSFVLGMDGYTQPSKLMPGEYQMAMNTINRGGIIQTRPGSRSLFDMPDGNLQGMTLFKTTNGVSNLVFAVDGLVYVSQSPFKDYAQLPSIQFSPYSKYISWAACLKSTDYTPEGVLYFLETPVNTLIMQDGATRAAYWDGASSGHIDPTRSDSTTTKPGFDGTLIGLWSCWSNNRLWVSRGAQIFASDIGNPLKFTEAQYLNEGRAFYLPGACTGMIETADRQGIICFTQEVGVLLQTSIQDRTTWLSTPGFQQTVLPNIGCCAPRSLVHQYGLIWWFTPKGLVSQNSALALNITSRMDIQDNEMIQSKANLCYDLSGVCGSFLENYLFHAVPYGDKINTRVHILDQAPFESGSPNSWPSYWTGWRPVEFARGVINSGERVFLASMDYDGKNRAWEIFQSDKTDNGIPITSFVVTKSHFFNNRDYKKFRYAEIEVQGLAGRTSMMVGIAGMRGAYQAAMVKDMNSIIGQAYSDSVYGSGSHSLRNYGIQTRIVKTEESPAASDCNGECVESNIRGLTDKCFSALIAWSGIAGISAYRLFAQSDPTSYQGECEQDETDEDRLLTVNGCGCLSRFCTKEPFTQYFATATYTRNDPVTSTPVSHTSTQASFISQLDANRKASAMAQWYVLSQLGLY